MLALLSLISFIIFNVIVILQKIHAPKNKWADFLCYLSITLSFIFSCIHLFLNNQTIIAIIHLFIIFGGLIMSIEFFAEAIKNGENRK